MIADEDFVFVSALNHYWFCPTRCYYIFVEQEFDENEHTVEGTLLHENVDLPGTTRRGEIVQTKRVYVYSRNLGICGIADVLEERRGHVYPVEYKKGKRARWRNDELQLCAQAFCLEEMLQTEISNGYIYYAASGRRREVPFHENLRQLTLRTIHEVRSLLVTRKRPEAIYKPRCKGCSFRTTICLPKEMVALRRYISHS